MHILDKSILHLYIEPSDEYFLQGQNSS
jgi:hypothetical protein